MRIEKHSYLVLFLLIAIACARQTSPTGGPKDTIPPILITSIPHKGQTNFKERTIDLEFSEAIILNNPKEQIIVTPDINKEYEITAKKKRVTITLKHKLSDSTTYSINFRDAVQDITEKNPAQNFKLAFSTGAYLDSISIQGKIQDPLTLKDAKDATVALYVQDTFNIFKHKPTYISKTDVKGIYRIENLKPGTYFLYAFDDKNKNLIVDSKTESYGFLAAPYTLDENESTANINLFKLDARPLKITSARPSGTVFNINFSKGLKNFSAKSARDTVVSRLSEDNSSIRIYRTRFEEDSTAVNITASDSIQNKIDTTIYVKFQRKAAKGEKLEMKSDEFTLHVEKGKLAGAVTFTKPIVTQALDTLLFQIDSLRSTNITEQDLTWNADRTIVRINKAIDKSLLPPKPSEEAPAKTSPQQPKELNKIIIGTGTFISVENDSTGHTELPVRKVSAENSGLITTTIQTTEPYFIVQLLDKNFKVIESRRNTHRVRFEDINPGDYRIRLIIDRNNDGEIGLGNFFKKENPEPILYYLTEKKSPIINLKANWELGPLLIKF